MQEKFGLYQSFRRRRSYFFNRYKVLEEGKISKKDLDRIYVTDSPEEVVARVKSFRP